jgi:uncharacterized protein (DUF1778 family)
MADDSSTPLKANGEQRRSARLEARVTADAHDQLRRAAALQGRSVSDFVASAAIEAARRTIADAGVITLSMEAYGRFLDAIDNPRPPSEALRQAFQKHRELIAPDR